MGTEYPAAPIVGVGGVVVRGEQVLVIRRAHDPRKGEWSVPGGVVELGESLTSALRRELHEETGLDVEIGPVVETFDRVHRDGDGRVRYHFVIVDFLCTAPSGEAIAGTDAEAVAWVGADELHAFGIDPHASAVLRKGLALARRIVES
ncbi:MAG: NUDIX hydrolase [Acidobacteria bacterium]|nr:NUDIX hydrolase [Acidobacteriota bacterium]